MTTLVLFFLISLLSIGAYVECVMCGCAYFWEYTLITYTARLKEPSMMLRMEFRVGLELGK